MWCIMSLHPIFVSLMASFPSEDNRIVVNLGPKKALEKAEIYFSDYDYGVKLVHMMQ